MSEREKIDVRTLTYKGVLFLNRDDLAAWLREIAATEPTDTRARLDEAADILRRLGT